jgi:hypothetical protein
LTGVSNRKPTTAHLATARLLERLQQRGGRADIFLAPAWQMQNRDFRRFQRAAEGGSKRNDFAKK